MPKVSAGLLMFRKREPEAEVFLVYLSGGPLWRKKDLGDWSIPKGEVDPGEERFAAAQREFEEETGIKPEGQFISLGERKQPSGKIVAAWAFEGDCSPNISSNTFSMEWPPKSGRIQLFPEVDRGRVVLLPKPAIAFTPARSASSTIMLLLKQR